MVSLIFSIAVLGIIVYVYVFDGDKNKIKKAKKMSMDKKNKKEKNVTRNKGKNLLKTQDKLTFEIKSSGKENDPALIVRENNTYCGIIEITGVNYNLLSLNERHTLEEVIQAVINGLEYPLQIYIISKKIDIENYNVLYEKRLEELNKQLKNEYNKLRIASNDSPELAREAQFNIQRLENQIVYGNNVIEFINNIAENANILENKYYIIVPYTYTGSIKDEDEKFITALNTISNRANTIIATLSGADIEGKMLNKLEIENLLYTSFNKKFATEYKLRKAYENGFDNFVKTAKPVKTKMLENKRRELEEIRNLYEKLQEESYDEVV